mgnify:CR=1 FL=1
MTSFSPDTPVQIVWFKRDLRLDDHAALMAATGAGPVVPLYVVEPDFWHQPDMSARQHAFLGDSVTELADQLAAAGTPLVIRVGAVETVLEALRQTLGPFRLWSHEETGNGWTFARDRVVAAWARQAGVVWTELSQCGVERGATSRNGWARRWDSWMARPGTVRPERLNGPVVASDPWPSARQLGLAEDPCPQRQPGGRTAGLERLRSFLETRGAPYRKAMSSPGPGALHCSRLSPHIALGTLSLREVAQAGWSRQAGLAQQARSGPWAGSMKSFVSRLHWRDHFMQKLEDEPRLENTDMHPGLAGLRPDAPDPVRLEAWSRGETGVPFVDACMRCLNETGWMNFRMRAMLVSFASYHLWQPWQASGTVLARKFTDYEPGIHWPQVQMQSGTTGVNAIRIYNPVKQGEDQDPDGAFTRRWLPELEAVPDRWLQQPWLWSGAGQVLGRIYPEPIIDLVEAARTAREAVFGRRREAGFRSASRDVLVRHGSRATPPGRRHARKKVASPPPANQMQLDL